VRARALGMTTAATGKRGTHLRAAAPMGRDHTNLGPPFHHGGPRFVPSMTRPNTVATLTSPQVRLSFRNESKVACDAVTTDEHLLRR
jgi:hypothetical protein